MGRKRRKESDEADEDEKEEGFNLKEKSSVGENDLEASRSQRTRKVKSFGSDFADILVKKRKKKDTPDVSPCKDSSTTGEGKEAQPDTPTPTIKRTGLKLTISKKDLGNMVPEFWKKEPLIVEGKRERKKKNFGDDFAEHSLSSNSSASISNVALKPLVAETPLKSLSSVASPLPITTKKPVVKKLKLEDPYSPSIMSPIPTHLRKSLDVKPKKSINIQLAGVVSQIPILKTFVPTPPVDSLNSPSSSLNLSSSRGRMIKKKSFGEEFVAKNLKRDSSLDESELESFVGGNAQDEFAQKIASSTKRKRSSFPEVGIPDLHRKSDSAPRHLLRNNSFDPSALLSLAPVELFDNNGNMNGNNSTGISLDKEAIQYDFMQIKPKKPIYALNSPDLVRKSDRVEKRKLTHSHAGAGKFEKEAKSLLSHSSHPNTQIETPWFNLDILPVTSSFVPMARRFSSLHLSGFIRKDDALILNGILNYGMNFEEMSNLLPFSNPNVCNFDVERRYLYLLSQEEWIKSNPKKSSKSNILKSSSHLFSTKRGSSKKKSDDFKRALWTREEEELLKREVMEKDFVSFHDLLQKKRGLFNPHRTPKSLEAHFYKMKRSGAWSKEFGADFMSNVKQDNTGQSVDIPNSNNIPEAMPTEETPTEPVDMLAQQNCASHSVSNGTKSAELPVENSVQDDSDIAMQDVHTKEADLSQPFLQEPEKCEAQSKGPVEPIAPLPHEDPSTDKTPAADLVGIESMYELNSTSNMICDAMGWRRREFIKSYKTSEQQHKKDLLSFEQQMDRLQWHAAHFGLGSFANGDSNNSESGMNTIAIIRGNNFRYAMKTLQIVIGKHTEESKVDFDLSGYAKTPLSNIQAIIKLKKDGNLKIQNVGKGKITINGVALPKTYFAVIPRQCFLEIAGAEMIVETNYFLIAWLHCEAKKL